MGRQFLRDLSVETLDDLPHRCRVCLFWELAPVDRAFAVEHDRSFEKEAWLSEATLTNGRCGKVAYRDGAPVGYALFGPPEIFAGAAAFPARVSKDALFLAVLAVTDDSERLGIGGALVRAALQDAKDRGKRALEAFGDRQWSHPACMIPAAFLETCGFKVKRDHPRFPLMRIDVRSLARFTESFEAAVEAFLGSVFAPEPAVSPSRAVARP